MSGKKPRIGICTDLEDGRGPRAEAEVPPFYFLKTAYADRVLEAGGIPLLLTPSSDAGVMEGYLSSIDALLVTGSGIDIPSAMYGHEPHPKAGRLVPAKSLFEVDLLRLAARSTLPFLGICNGMQAMNVAYGGTLYQDLPSERGVAHTSEDATVPCHDVILKEGSLLYAIVGKPVCDVNSSHHQAVREVGTGLTISANAGDGTVEGIEDPAKPFALGVQWHPELIPEHANSRGLFAALVEAARKALPRDPR